MLIWVIFNTTIIKILNPKIMVNTVFATATTTKFVSALSLSLKRELIIFLKVSFALASAPLV